MFLTFDASLGVIFTLKALIIVIMGGVERYPRRDRRLVHPRPGRDRRRHLIDPGLTLAAAYLLFMVVLLVRPEGLFGRRSS